MVHPLVIIISLGFYCVLLYMHDTQKRMHRDTQKQLKAVEAKLVVIRKQMEGAAFDNLIAYIKEHEGKDAIKEFPGPTRPETRKWLINHGILAYDRQTLIFKYLEKALNPPTDEKI